MFFKKKKSEKEKYSIEIIRKIKISLMDLEELYKKSSKSSVQQAIKEIIKNVNKILQGVVSNPEKIYELGLFSEYLLPEVTKVAKFIVECNCKKVSTEIVENAKQCLLDSEKAFKKIANDITLENKSIIESEIAMLSHQLKKTENDLE